MRTNDMQHDVIMWAGLQARAPEAREIETRLIVSYQKRSKLSCSLTVCLFKACMDVY